MRANALGTEQSDCPLDMQDPQNAYSTALGLILSSEPPFLGSVSLSQSVALAAVPLAALIGLPLTPCRLSPGAMTKFQTLLVLRIVIAHWRQTITNRWIEFRDHLRSPGMDGGHAIPTFVWDGRFSVAASGETGVAVQALAAATFARFGLCGHAARPASLISGGEQ
jgi:ABC-type tungstate transport system substrate-binding protein